MTKKTKRIAKTKDNDKDQEGNNYVGTIKIKIGIPWIRDPHSEYGSRIPGSAENGSNADPVPKH